MTAAAVVVLVAAPFLAQLLAGLLVWNRNGRPQTGIYRGTVAR